MSKIRPRTLIIVSIMLVLLKMPLVAAQPSECQDVWRIDLHAVARLSATEQYFSKLKYDRWEQNRWQPSDAETFFDTQQSEIPLIFFVPGYTSTTPQTTRVGLGVVQTFDPTKPCRVVFLDWYSDKEMLKIRRDIRSKLSIINNTADYLTLILQEVRPQAKVCLFGFSFGSRIVCQAVESLRQSGQRSEGMRLHLVLSGAATDQFWFAAGNRHDKIPEIVEKILVTYNPDDWALQFYPLMYSLRCQPKALGLEGLPMRSIDPKYRDRFENLDVSHYIGNEHQTLYHVRNVAFRSRINAYFFFE
ncbi:MAG: hypothetical protein LBI05_10605 [Planctomycetaceae bacterium]|jgi:hypothetical protein|nr:hypothetical protein [Planctomycetaceae bacterium]